jgi:hypothetical protein
MAKSDPNATADPEFDARGEAGMTDDVPEGDRVTVDPTLADEEVVPPDQYEGDLDEDDSPDGQDEPEGSAKERTSFGNDPERNGTN